MSPAKRCTICKAVMIAPRARQKVCGEVCAEALVEKAKRMAEKAAVLADKRETKAKLEKLKSRAQWLKEAKTAAQRYRRLEELALGSGCMSCGRSQEQVAGTDAWKPGGAWDGGHFLSKGARPELALEPLNIWLQCKSCNAGSSKYARKGHTVNASFRLNLIARIGLAAVEALEADQTPRNYSVDDLKALKADYAARARALKKDAP